MPTSPLSNDEFNRLETACRNLATSSVQADEAEAARCPMLILMSTVLSLNRRWYSHALPARRHFEENLYTRLSPKTLRTFRDAANSGSVNRTDWLAFARVLWGRNEWDKARILTELVDYFVDWTDSHAPNATDLEALQRWSSEVTKKEFVGQKIKGLGPRAHEQLLWYIQGKEAINLGRHVTTFVNEIINRPLTDDELLNALKQVAIALNISPTTLDVRIWDHMQSRKKRSSTQNRRNRTLP